MAVHVPMTVRWSTVCDLRLQDYTIFDLGSSAERPEELARPHLHEFMSAVYPHYVSEYYTLMTDV
jgi:hypothetical protein